MREKILLFLEMSNSTWRQRKILIHNYNIIWNSEFYIILKQNTKWKRKGTVLWILLWIYSNFHSFCRLYQWEDLWICYCLYEFFLYKYIYKKLSFILQSISVRIFSLFGVEYLQASIFPDWSSFTHLPSIVF